MYIQLNFLKTLHGDAINILCYTHEEMQNKQIK